MNSEAMKADERLKAAILAYVAENPAKLTREAVTRKFSPDHSKKALKAAVRALLEENALCYSAMCGVSFLELSYNRPVRVSERLVLAPPRVSYSPKAGEVMIRLIPGAAFGLGNHPSTRLALRGLDRAMPGIPGTDAALDIGTGSGVLAMAAVGLGMASALALDTEGCARAEAGRNLALNRMENRIRVSDQAVEELAGSYPLILANLRYPTLMGLYPNIHRLCRASGGVVVSGVKSDESQDLIETYSRGFDCHWQETEKGWMGALFFKSR